MITFVTHTHELRVDVQVIWHHAKQKLQQRLQKRAGTIFAKIIETRTDATQTIYTEPDRHSYTKATENKLSLFCNEWT